LRKKEVLSSESHPETALGDFANLVMEDVDLFVQKRPVHRPVVDPVALADAVFLVLEGIKLGNRDVSKIRHRRKESGSGAYQLHSLNEIAANLSNGLVKVVLVEVGGDPEGDVLQASRVLGVGRKLDNLVALELAQEPLVRAPEQANIRNAKEHHGKPLETQAKGVPDLGVLDLSLGNDFLLDDAAPQNFHPAALEIDFQLPRRVGEGEVGVYPAILEVWIKGAN